MVVGGRELIDTLWNVNERTFVKSFAFCTELIDTLWNVNKSKIYINGFEVSELIDTLWNVNTLTLRRFSLTNKN